MASRPQRIGEVLSQLIARAQLGQLHGSSQWDAAWRGAAGPAAAKYSRIGRFHRGVVEVIVANSTVLQELSFRKHELLKALAAAMPEADIRDVRFRVGVVG